MTTFLDNMLDQALDIAGTIDQLSNLTSTDESLCLGSPLTGQSGAAASITLGATVTVTGLTGMTAASINNFLEISGAATPGNNGSFLIVTFNSATSVDISNGAAATDANNGAISWTERSAYTLQSDMNYVRTDRSAIKGVAFDAAIPTYLRCTDQSTPVPASLANIAGKTTDAKAFVINRKFENAVVVTGDGYFTMTGTGLFPHADSVNVTGVPINDGYDIGNDPATYVEIIADGYAQSLLVLTGGNAGQVIFGRTRAGSTGTEPDSVEVEFRSVAIDSDISVSSPYTWEAGHVNVVDLYYGFRNCLDDMDENAFRTTLVNGLIGDAALSATGTDDLHEIIGTTPGDTDLAGLLTPTTDFFVWSDLPDVTPSVVEALNTINTQIGDRIFIGPTLDAKDGYTITELIQGLGDAIDLITADGYTVIRTIERTAGEISAGTEHTLPGGLSYTLDPADNGRFLWLYWRGVLKDPGDDVGEGDYEETSTTSFTPYSKVKSSDRINYFIVTP